MNTKSRIFHETGAAERFEKLEKQTTPKTYELGVDPKYRQACTYRIRKGKLTDKEIFLPALK